MTTRIIFCGAIAVFLVCALANAQPSGEYPIRSFTDASGKRTGYFISHKRLAATPEWIFDGTSGPPLSLADAHRIASRWIAQKHPKIDSFRIRSYSVEEAGNSRARNRWYYSFDFIGSVDGTEIYGGPFTAMVLMDGTVIEPREIKADET